jgi:homocysteine S-methyltransferase
VRMSVLPTAMLVRDATGLDINMHFTCRDRNLMGIQADLLGACRSA